MQLAFQALHHPPILLGDLHLEILSLQPQRLHFLVKVPYADDRCVASRAVPVSDPVLSADAQDG